MKRYMWALLFIIMVALPTIVSANDLNHIYVWNDVETWKEGDSIPEAAVRWYRIDREYYLFLPSGFDTSNLHMHLTGGARYVTINGEKIMNDSSTSVFQPGETLNVLCGKDEFYKVHVLQSQNTGAVFLRTKSTNLENIQASKRNLEAGSWVVMDKNGMIDYSDAFEYVRGRGNASFKQKKTPFHVKLVESTSILGMDEGKTWVLIASYRDNSMIRNAITLDMATDAGMNYTSQYRFVDVYANRLYYGTYILAEKVQQGKNRVNISNLQKETEKVNAKALNRYEHKGEIKYTIGTQKYYDIPNNPEDITGGYLLQLEVSYRYKEGTVGFVTNHGQGVLLKDPGYASKAQVSYICSLVQSFENAIFAEDGIDPQTGKHFFEIADKDSLVGKYLVEEISKNLDANITSYYLYKYNDYISDKLYFGPVWDYDNAYGMYTSDKRGPLFTTLNDPDGLFAGESDNIRTCWFAQLYTHPEFVEAVKKAYRDVYRPLIEVLLSERLPEESSQLRSLNAYHDMLVEASEMNFTRWPTFNDSAFPVETGENFEANIEYLRDFLTIRMKYLDSIWITE